MRLVSWLRQPWLHFIVLGGLLFYLQGVFFPEPKPVVGPLSEARIEALNPEVLIVTGDHSTPCIHKEHSWHPVPTLIRSPLSLYRKESKFTERDCMTGLLTPGPTERSDARATMARAPASPGFPTGRRAPLPLIGQPAFARKVSWRPLPPGARWTWGS